MTEIRVCPLCGAAAGSKSFPYATIFSGVLYSYYRCRYCQTVFVDPVPDSDAFAKMYAKSAYHDQHYSGSITAEHIDSITLLSQFASKSSRTLDYGCGAGAFLAALKSQGFSAEGVEFDANAARFAAETSGCRVTPLNEFLSENADSYEVIHLGDVLEHLPDPRSVINSLLGRLTDGGVLFVEGPLENNASPVFWAARVFGSVKYFLRPDRHGSSAPTHLLRTHAQAQKNFFASLNIPLRLVHWQVYESGWPYAQGRGVKKIIAKCAIMLGEKKFAGVTFGNRFRAILRK